MKPKTAQPAIGKPTPLRFGRPATIQTASGSVYQIDGEGVITHTTSSIGEGYKVLGAADSKDGEIDHGIIELGRPMRIFKPGSTEGLTSRVVSWVINEWSQVK